MVHIPSLKIPRHNTELLERAGIDTNNTNKNTNEDFLIQDKNQKLNILGAHFVAINRQNIYLGKEQLNRVMKRDTDYYIKTDIVIHRCPEDK